MMHQEMLKEFKGWGQNVIQNKKLRSAQAQEMPCKKLMSCRATT